MIFLTVNSSVIILYDDNLSIVRQFKHTDVDAAYVRHGNKTIIFKFDKHSFEDVIIDFSSMKVINDKSYDSVTTYSPQWGNLTEVVDKTFYAYIAYIESFIDCFEFHTDVSSSDVYSIQQTTGSNTGDETLMSIRAKRPIKKINNVSLEGSGEVYTWQYLSTSWTTPPTLHDTTATGRIYKYQINTKIRYRFVPNIYIAEQDAFYEDSNLTILITTRA